MIAKKIISTLGAAKAGVFQRLENDSDLMSVVNGVFDAVEKGTKFPYIVLGEMTAIPFDSKQSAGQEVTLTIHTWSDYPGDDEILSVIHPKILRAISHSPIDVGENLGVMLARLDTEETIQEPDGRIRQGIIRLRFRIMEV